MLLSSVIMKEKRQGSKRKVNKRKKNKIKQFKIKQEPDVYIWEYELADMRNFDGFSLAMQNDSQ
ncbi:hypothetical protein DOY81_007914 [Sarcophaga bullata]|nr:hypothetical protein DOY81_007914 [Sarcophaga bullata]